MKNKELPDSEFVTMKAGAAMVGVSIVSINRYIRQKKLHRYKVGARRTLLRRSEVLGLVREA